MTTAMSNTYRVRISSTTLPPYVIIGLAWFAFLMLAFQVRTIEPVYLWVWAHGTILEKAGYSTRFWTSRGILLVAYLIAALLAWLLVEIGPRDPRHVWRRAILAWCGIQILFCLVAAFLTHSGVLSE